MDFRGHNVTRLGAPDRFDISQSELENAQMGFEAIGTPESGLQVWREPKSMGVKDTIRARQVIAGNLALVNSLSQLRFTRSSAVQETIAAAQRTVETGLTALRQAEMPTNIAQEADTA